jgi:hypothetical protein
MVPSSARPGPAGRHAFSAPRVFNWKRSLLRCSFRRSQRSPSASDWRRPAFTSLRVYSIMMVLLRMNSSCFERRARGIVMPPPGFFSQNFRQTPSVRGTVQATVILMMGAGPQGKME